MRLHSERLMDANIGVLVDKVSETYYDGNLQLEQAQTRGTDRKGRDKTLFTLCVRDSRGPGARRSASGRHMPKASWEAHRDVMRAIFAFDPCAFLHTALADYDGKADFERKFEATGDRNVGSMMNPVSFRDTTV